jgi:hypothetical protein
VSIVIADLDPSDFGVVSIATMLIYKCLDQYGSTKPGAAQGYRQQAYQLRLRLTDYFLRLGFSSVSGGS